MMKDILAGRDWADAIKFLAEAKDEENFRVVVDSVSHTIIRRKNMKLYAKEPLAFIESFCMVLDQPTKSNYHMLQTYRGLKLKIPPMGKTQKFFQKIYGSHFFVKQ